MKGARLAIDVITYNDKLERAFQYACGNTLVCDTLEIAKYICYEKNQQVKGKFFFFFTIYIDIKEERKFNSFIIISNFELKFCSLL